MTIEYASFCEACGSSADVRDVLVEDWSNDERGTFCLGAGWVALCARCASGDSEPAAVVAAAPEGPDVGLPF